MVYGVAGRSRNTSDGLSTQAGRSHILRLKQRIWDDLLQVSEVEILQNILKLPTEDRGEGTHVSSSKKLGR